MTPPVIVTVPDELGSVEVCVRHEEYGVEVDVRPAGTVWAWVPIKDCGGSFTVRPC